MSIDMEQFHQVFFDESFEGLNIMESGLLNLDMGDVAVEEINTIFRAAHSIKGGSGTFGFSSLSDFTHIMETLLDEMREGRRQVSQPIVNILLSSVDCLREMLNAIQDKKATDDNKVAELKSALEVELNGTSEKPEVLKQHKDVSVSKDEITEIDYTDNGWLIEFKPYPDLLKTGNDPVRIFRELNELGTLLTTVGFQNVPDFYDLDPEECFLSWNLTVKGDIPKDDVSEVFDWVEDDCDLSIEPLSVKENQQDQAGFSRNAVIPDPELSQTGSYESNVTEDTQTANSVQIEKSENNNPQEKTGNNGAVNSSTQSSSTIRVDTRKIDTLINMVGELVITQSMLSLVGENFEINRLDQLKNGLSQLDRHTRELQESVMNIRMLPISFVFSRFPRLVHDLSNKLDKKIDLVLVGENTEVDKTVVELLSDPLVHLVRNSLDHGIEMPADRVIVGKPETGTITLEAFHRGGNIVIEVKDDGKGLDKDMLKTKAILKGLINEETVLTDKQSYELIFMAGFSTAQELSDISGRGVGMDVVRRNIQSLGGSIEILSELGVGTTISIHLPLTLAILDGQSIAVGDERYIIPLGSIVESVNISSTMINRIAGKGETFCLRNEYLPIVRMHEVFNVNSVKTTKLTEGLIVVVEGQGVRCGLFIDDLLGQQQVVIKSLEANYRKVEGVSGATILGDGSVALILDIPGLLRLSNQ